MTFEVAKNTTGQLFISYKYISESQLEKALVEADCRIGEWLLKAKLIDADQLAQVLARHYGLEYVNLKDYTVDPTLFNILPAYIAIRHQVVPYKVKRSSLYVAITSLDDYNLEQKLEIITKHNIIFVIGSAARIQDILLNSDGAGQMLDDVSQQFRTSLVKESVNGELELIDLEKLGDDKAPIIKLVNTIVISAIKKRASDIHIESYHNRVDIKYRIDGVLYPATEQLDSQYHSALVTRLKVMAELDVAEKRLPQDGRFKLNIDNTTVDFRISILPTIYGEDIVVRILDKKPITHGNEKNKITLDILGMDSVTLKKFRKAIHEPYGMVLITGPTGSGKTTSLYAAITEIHTGADKIVTIEDPVEYELDGIIQIPVNNKKELTFAKGLRSILRHDPDKIMVGEIRDEETAKIAIQSALTGHLVFSTVHSNNSIDVISRFNHMGIDTFSLVSSLNCVMAQRLVRHICQYCSKEKHYELAYLNDFCLDKNTVGNIQFKEGPGCDKCNYTGYLGRVAITEFLNISTQMRDLMLSHCPRAELYKVAKEEGLTTLRESAIQLALAGITTLEEVNRVTFVDG